MAHTVDITGGFEFCLTPGPFGFSISGGGDDGTGGAQTGPLLCYVGDGSGGPDNNGGVDAFDLWVPDLRGVCSGTVFFGGPPFDFSSWYTALNKADEEASTQAASAFNPGIPPNPADYTVLSDPVIGGTFSGVVNYSKGHPIYFVLIYPGGTLNFSLGACRTIICDITQPQILAIGPVPNGVQFDLPLSKNTNDCGVAVCSQGVCLGGGIPFSLTNAWDSTAGF